MSDIPKGHMGSAGVVPVFLSAPYVWVLHRYAHHENYLAQEAAEQILEEFLYRYALVRGYDEFFAEVAKQADATDSNSVAP